MRTLPLAASACLMSALSLSPMANAAEPDGKALHQEKCTSCHGGEMYTRKDRKVGSLDALGKQVRMCTNNVPGINWFPDQVDAVIEYLNTDYYKFGQ